MMKTLTTLFILLKCQPQCVKGGGVKKVVVWDNRCLDLAIGVELGGDPLRAAFDPAISAIYG